MSTADGVGRWDPGALGRLETAVGGRSHVIATPQKLEQKLLKFGNFWLILETSKALNFLVFEIFCSSFLRCRN